MINKDTMNQLNKLRSMGWIVEMRERKIGLPKQILKRYSWLPKEWTSFLGHVKNITSPDDTIWVLSAEEYAGSTETAFAWNAWEKLSLECAEQDNDPEWRKAIQKFWNGHFPIVMSVGSGYAYCALRRSDMKVVHGLEPDFEGVTVFADDPLDLVGKLNEAW